MVLLTVLAVSAAFSLRNTRINYDLTSYLAEDTDTKRGLDLMNGEFTPTSSMSLVLIDADEEEARQHATRIAAMEPVLMATHDPQEGLREQDGHTYRLISITLDASQESEVLDAVEAQVRDVPHLLGGAASENRSLQDSIFSEMPVVMVVGKVLKAPEVYTDERGKVTNAYQDELEKAWIEELRAKHTVVINHEVLDKLKIEN